MLRDERIGELLRARRHCDASAQIACVGLKGAALRALGLYRPAKGRWGTWTCSSTPATFGDRGRHARHRLRRGVHDQRHVSYEPRTSSRHTVSASTSTTRSGSRSTRSVAERLPVRMVDITSLLRSAEARPGLNPYPSTAALLLHLLLHAAGNMQTHCLRQIQLHDIAALASRLRGADWGAVLGGARSQRSWWAFPPLALAARYYPGASRRKCSGSARPVPARAAFRDGPCGAHGCVMVEPAHSCVAGDRLVPDAARRSSLRAQPRAAEPQLARGAAVRPAGSAASQTGAVVRHSHGKRIVRWLFSHPPRVQTMVSVKAALESAGVGDEGRRVIVSTRRLFCRLLRTFDIATVCDVGSMDGADALRFRRALPNAAVLALEPNPRNFALMAADDRAQTRGHSSLAGRGQRPPIRGAVVRRRCGLRSRPRFGAPRHELSATSARTGLDCRPLCQCRLFVSTSSSWRSRCTPGRSHCGSTRREWRSR